MSSFGSACRLRSVRRTAIALMAVAGLTVRVGPVSAEELKFTLKDARLTIVADNATLQEILAEWTRVGHTEFVGADTLGDQRVTAQLFDVAEADALEVLLRSTAGYLARYRAGPADSRSSFDRVRILARSEPSTPLHPASAPVVLEQSENIAPPQATTATHGAATSRANQQILQRPPNGGGTYSPRQAGAAAPDSQTEAAAPVPRFVPLSPFERAGQRLSRPVPQGPAAAPAPPAKTLPVSPPIPSNPFYNAPRPK
jgi:hypothetical protein